MTVEENIKFREDIIKKQFKNALGYGLNLDNPQTFNEKLQWLKLYYHDPLMTKCADKYLVREYIKETIGEEYLIPLIGVYDKVEDINFDSLPNQFVLKVNWGSGMNIIVKDKNKLNIEDAKKQLTEWMRPTSNHYYYSYEWPYKNIVPKIICETFMKNNNFDNLTVYKTFCFNGEPYLFQVIIDDKTKDEKINYYDLNWNRLELKQNFDNFNFDLQKPNNLENMIKLAKILASNFKYFVRVDLFEINNKLYFSEYTFFSDNGIAKFDPEYWDLKLGKLIDLPKEKKLEYDYISKEELIEQVSNLEPIIEEYRDLKVQFDSNTINNKITIFNLITLFNIDLFSISKDSKYLTITILGIKITCKL